MKAAASPMRPSTTHRFSQLTDLAARGSGRAARSALFCGNLHLGSQLLPEFVEEAAEFRVVMDEKDIARPGDIDAFVAKDAPRTAAHQQDAVGERDGLGQVMRHEEDGAAGAFP